MNLRLAFFLIVRKNRKRKKEQRKRILCSFLYDEKQAIVEWFNGDYVDVRNVNKKRCKMDSHLRLPPGGSWRQRRLKESACSFL